MVVLSLLRMASDLINSTGRLAVAGGLTAVIGSYANVGPIQNLPTDPLIDQLLGDYGDMAINIASEYTAMLGDLIGGVI